MANILKPSSQTRISRGFEHRHIAVTSERQQNAILDLDYGERFTYFRMDWLFKFYKVLKQANP